MARGNNIIVSAFPQGKKVEGYIGAGLTPVPGTIMQIDFSVAMVGGKHTWKAYTPGTDGDRPTGPLIVLDFDQKQGRTATAAYVDGDRAFGYIPQAGDELNLLVADAAGTGDVHNPGDVYMVDTGTGKLIATTGTPNTKPFVQLDSAFTPTADTLTWVIYTGY